MTAVGHLRPLASIEKWPSGPDRVGLPRSRASPVSSVSPRPESCRKGMLWVAPLAMDFGTKNVLLCVTVPCSAGPLWYRLRSSFCGPKVHSAVSSRRRTEPDLHLIKQV